MSEIANFLIDLMSAGEYNDIHTPDINRVKWMSEQLKNIGCECEFKIFNDTGNLYSVIGNKNSEKNICFCGHCDVVPAKKWTKRVSGEIVENKVYGRGAVDMLGAVASWFFAVKRFIEDDKNSGNLLKNIKITTLLTGDEEGDGTNGTNKMVDYLINKGEKIDACIVGEPTSEYLDLNIDNYKLDSLCYSRGGSFHFWITVKGKSGHVAYFDEFDNPITKAVKLCYQLKQMSFEEFNEKMTNLEIVSFDAVNSVHNVILDEVKIHGNIRFFKDQKNQIDSYEVIKKKIENVCNLVLKEKFETKYQCDRQGYLTDINNDFLKLAMSCFKRYNDNSKFVVTRACTDGEYMTRICKNVCEIGLKCKMMHQVDEYTTINDLNDLAKIYQDIISEYAKSN